MRGQDYWKAQGAKEERERWNKAIKLGRERTAKPYLTLVQWNQLSESVEKLKSSETERSEVTTGGVKNG